MVIDHVASQARFSGPQLIFSQITGQTTGGGTVSGSGNVTFSGGKTLLNLSFNANQALLLNRDDVAARVTGPLQLKSDASGGAISGDLNLNKGRFQLGRASAAAAVPQLNVRETGLDEEDVIEPAAAPSVEAQPQARRQRPPGHRPRHQQPLDHQPPDRRRSPTRRASPAAPTSSRAITISPAASSASTAGSSASAAKARPIRCSTSMPKRRSRASTRR